MTLNQIHYFRILAKTQNMHQAAEILFLSQPSLSAALQKLERELDVRLFDRVGHRIRLTPEGQLFLTHCERIEAEVQNARIHMEALSTQKKTIVNIGCVEPLLREYLPEKMRAFLENPANSGVDFQVYDGFTAEMAAKVKKGELDFFIGSETEDEALQQTLLMQTPLVLIRRREGQRPAAKTYGKAALFKESPCTWEALTKLPLLGYPQFSAMDHILEKMWMSLNISFHYRYRMPNETAILALVANGFGSAIIPWVDELRNFPVDIFPLPSGAFGHRLCIATRKDHALEGAAGDFSQFLLSSRPDDFTLRQKYASLDQA